MIFIKRNDEAQENKFQVTGYNHPSYFEHNKKIVAQTLVTDSGDIKSNHENGSILCNIDTTEGQSGSPIWTVYKNNVFAVGIITNNFSLNLSQGLGFTTEITDVISYAIVGKLINREVIDLPKIRGEATKHFGLIDSTKIINPHKRWPFRMFFLKNLLIVGDKNVGKTSLIKSYIDNSLFERQSLNPQIDCSMKKITLYGQNYRLFLEEHSSKIFTNGHFEVNGIAFIFDLTKRKTFNNLSKWLKKNQKNFDHKLIVYIVGNKSDKLDQRETTYEEALKFASSKGFPYFETSAEVSMGIDQMFNSLVEDTKNSYVPLQRIDRFHSNYAFIEN